MSGPHRRRLRRRAVADHDIARLQLRFAEGLGELRGPGAQLRRGRRPLRPHPHRCRARRSAKSAREPARRVRHPARTSRAIPALPPRLHCRHLAARSRTAPSPFPAGSQMEFRNANVALSDRSAPRLLSTRSGSEATCNRVCRAMAASVSPSSRCAVAASGAPDAIDGSAIGCAEGSAPRNGGGGVLVWNVTSPREFCNEASGKEVLPSSMALAKTPPPEVKTAPVQPRVAGSRGLAVKHDAGNGARLQDLANHPRAPALPPAAEGLLRQSISGDCDGTVLATATAQMRAIVA